MPDASASAAASWIEGELGDGSAPALAEAMTWFRSLEESGQREGLGTLVVAAARSRLRFFAEALLADDASEQERERVLGMELLELCLELGFTKHQAAMAERCAWFLMGCDPFTSQVFEEALLAEESDSLSLSRFDLLRRLVPANASPERAREVLAEVSGSTVRELRNAARILASTRRSGELERRDKDGDPDVDPRGALFAEAGFTEELDDEIRERLQHAAGKRKLHLRTSVEDYARLKEAVGRELRLLAMPWRDRLPVADERDALKSILAEFLTERHPLRKPSRAIELAGRDALVRTICPPCQKAHPLPVGDIVERLRRQGRLHSGQTPEPLLRLVLLRSGLRCEIPGCERGAEQVHHIHPRRKGIRHHPENLVGLCAAHHRRVEMSDDNPRRIVLEGRAPHGLIVTFPDGRVVRSRDAAPSGWEIAWQLRESGEVQDLFRSSVESLAWGDAPRAQRVSGSSPVRIQRPRRGVTLQTAEARRVDEAKWQAHLAEAGFCAAAADLCALGDPGGKGELRDLGFERLADYAAAVYGLSTSEASERRAVGEARRLYPECWKVHLTHTQKKRHLLDIARSGLGQDYDSLLARLMPFLSSRDTRQVLGSLKHDDEQVSWSLSVDAELAELIATAALEVRRAHGSKLCLEEVLSYIVDAHERGCWPAIPDRPFTEECSLGLPSLTRRSGPPGHAAHSFECAHCDAMWRVDAHGEVSFPTRQECELLRATAGTAGHPRVRLIPPGYDPDPRAGTSFQPHPNAEREAAERDGGCVVPGCERIRVRACSGRWLSEGVAPPDVRRIPASELVTMCSGHLRALLSSGVVGGSCQLLQNKGEANGDAPATVDIEKLLRRIARLEAAEAPP